MRIDDIDPPREVPGAAAVILRQLESLGLTWDDAPLYQRTAREHHREVCASLLAQGLAFRCRCSRRELGVAPYPGTCRAAAVSVQERHAVRVKVPTYPVSIQDVRLGRLDTDLQREGGDFVIWRVEDLPAYHLASVCDDATLGITDVVRGGDLLDSAPRQAWLQTLLNFPAPRYLHLPVAVDPQGVKLSKQNLAAPVDSGAPSRVLSLALAWLGLPLPGDLAGASPAVLLSYAIQHWRYERLPNTVTWPAPIY